MLSPTCKRAMKLANTLGKPSITVLLDRNWKHGQDEKIDQILNESRLIELTENFEIGWSDDKIKDLNDMIKLQLSF